MKKEFFENHYRVKKFENEYLIITEQGAHLFLDNEDYDSLRFGKIANKKLFTRLEDAGVILTKKNIPRIVDISRKRYSFLYQGTSLHIVIPTLTCNLRCVYCHASARPISNNRLNMTEDTAQKFVDFVFQSPSNFIIIEFQGGEPLLNFPIVKYIIEYSKKINQKYNKIIDFRLVTNLGFMTNEKFNFFVKNNISICTSLDGPEFLHNINRPYNSYNSIIKWIKKADELHNKGEYSRKIDALVTITRNSLPYWKEIVDEYAKFNINTINLRFLNYLGYAKNIWNDVGYTAEEFLDFWKKSVDYIIELNKRGIELSERMVVVILRKIFEEFDPNFMEMRNPCGAAIGQLAYNYNGDIYTCDEGRMVKEGIFKLGNVKADTYKEVVSSPATCAIIHASINDTQICDYCVYKPYCGICPVCNYSEQDSIIAKINETNRCKVYKGMFDYLFGKIKNDVEALKIFLGWIGQQYNP